MGCCSVTCLASLLGDFLLCRVLVGRFNSAGSPLLCVILSLDDRTLTESTIIMDKIIEMNKIWPSEFLLCVDCGQFAGFKLEIHEILLFEFPLAFGVMKVGSWFGNA